MLSAITSTFTEDEVNVVGVFLTSFIIGASLACLHILSSYFLTCLVWEVTLTVCSTHSSCKYILLSHPLVYAFLCSALHLIATVSSVVVTLYSNVILSNFGFNSAFVTLKLER